MKAFVVCENLGVAKSSLRLIGVFSSKKHVWSVILPQIDPADYVLRVGGKDYACSYDGLCRALAKVSLCQPVAIGYDTMADRSDEHGHQELTTMFWPHYAVAETVVNEVVRDWEDQLAEEEDQEQVAVTTFQDGQPCGRVAGRNNLEYNDKDEVQK